MKPVNKNLIKITELLGDGHFHDGTSIGSQLHITRAAVWKIMKKLEQYKIPLCSIKGKGYRLESPLILLNPVKIKKGLRHCKLQLDVVEETESTNDHLYKSIHNCNKNINVCIAEMQTQGKGRFNRPWHSPFAENIYLSLQCPFDKDISELSGLSLVIGLAICHAVESVVKINAPLMVKWPNDIFVNKKKLAGSLIEIQGEPHGNWQVIIGIGLNVNMYHVSKNSIGQPWTSLLNLTGQYHDRNDLCIALIDNLIIYLQRFFPLGLADFMPDWEKRDYLRHSLVSVKTGNIFYKGVCVGISHKGHLLLESADKKIYACSSGYASIAK